MSDLELFRALNRIRRQIAKHGAKEEELKSPLVLLQKGRSTDEARAKAAIPIGSMLYGYCRGMFGRDSYSDKLVVGIKGDTITVRELDGSDNETYNTGDVYSWVDLLEASNDVLKGRQGDEE